MIYDKIDIGGEHQCNASMLQTYLADVGIGISNQEVGVFLGIVLQSIHFIFGT
jgi:hypothetical protein